MEPKNADLGGKETRILVEDEEERRKGKGEGGAVIWEENSNLGSIDGPDKEIGKREKSMERERKKKRR